MSTNKLISDFKNEPFDWSLYLNVRNAKEVPKDFFYHICKSEDNGIEPGSVVEVENQDHSGYWFASVCSSKGVSICLHYLGDENDKLDFWLDVNSSRVHPLNWGSENNKELVPPNTERFLNVNPEVIKEKVQDCEHVVSHSVLQMEGSPIYNIFKPDMFVEVQDKEYPYRVWVSKILKNVGGRLLLNMQGLSSPEKKPFWLFYLNERVFPLGWAEQKGLPWRVMNLDVSIEGANDSSLLLSVKKPKTPEQHSYKVGEMLEVINPYSLMVFYVATIVKIYDNRYFKVEVNNETDVDKRITFVATKENPYLFNAGWANKHKFLLKPPSDWKSQDRFCWSKYATMKNSKLAVVDNVRRRKINYVNIGMKLESVDPVNPDRIRVATVKGFGDHWMFLSFDRSSWHQDLLHIRSIYSDDIFPVGWCKKHKYPLSTPKNSWANISDYENRYYASDVDTEFDESDKENLTKYPYYFKGEILYHFSKKGSQQFGEYLEEPLQIKKSDESSDVSKTTNCEIVVHKPFDIKVELDEEFHDALFEEDAEEKKIKDKEKEVAIVKMKNISQMPSQIFYKNSYTMCIYFNKLCYPGNHLIRKKISKLPDSIGPGPVSKVLQEAITLLVNISCYSVRALKKIKEFQDMLFNGPGGIEMIVTTKKFRSNDDYSENLILPESKKMAETYCTDLCHLNGMCEYFMNSKCVPVCPIDCNSRINTISKLKPNEMTVPRSMKATKRKNDTTNFMSADYSKRPRLLNKRESTLEKIRRVAKEQLDWSNEPLVERYKYYMGCIINFDKHTQILKNSFTQYELAILAKIQSIKNYLRIMDRIDIYSNTKSELHEFEEKELPFIDNWKTSFETLYRNDMRFANCKIDIGHFEPIKVMSNPKYWSPDEVYKYLSDDLYCRDFGKILVKELFDGIAFMHLNEEQIVHRLKCPINLAIRMMCHVAEVKYMFLTKYCDT